MTAALVHVEAECPRDLLELLGEDAVPVALASSPRAEDWIGRVMPHLDGWRIFSADFAVDRLGGLGGNFSTRQHFRMRQHSLASRLAALCRGQGFRAIHAWGIEAAAVAAGAALEVEVPLLVSLAEGETEMKLAGRSAELRAALRVAAACSAPSAEEARAVRTLLAPSGTVHVIPPFLRKVRAKFLSLGVEGPVIGTFGTLCRETGLDTLLEAFARLCDTRPAWLLLGGAMLPREAFYLAPLLDGHPRADRLLRMGVVEAPAAAMSACNVLAFPQATSTQARCVLEGMASGVPVLSCAVGAVADVAVDGKSARLLPAGDAAAWGAALDVLLRDGEGARAMGRAGQRQVRPLQDASRARALWRTFYGEAQA